MVGIQASQNPIRTSLTPTWTSAEIGTNSQLLSNHLTRGRFRSRCKTQRRPRTWGYRISSRSRQTLGCKFRKTIKTNCCRWKEKPAKRARKWENESWVTSYYHQQSSSNVRWTISKCFSTGNSSVSNLLSVRMPFSSIATCNWRGPCSTTSRLSLSSGNSWPTLMLKSIKRGLSSAYL